MNKEKNMAMVMANKDWKILHEIGKAIEAKRGCLFQVQRDSPEWASWHTWMHEHGMTTVWSDAQPGDRMMTVTFPWAPTDEALNDPQALIMANSGKRDQRPQKLLE